jgi:hypothetical protein
MPRVSTWLIRTAMVHLVSGAVLGAAFLTWKAVGWFAFAPSHLGVHTEEMLVGWLVQLVIGVGYWILPRPPGQQPEDSGALMWLVWGLLNAGVLAAGLREVPGWPALFPLGGRVAEFAAVTLFVAHAWNRQRAYRATTRRVLV